MYLHILWVPLTRVVKLFYDLVKFPGLIHLLLVFCKKTKAEKTAHLGSTTFTLTKLSKTCSKYFYLPIINP